MKIMPLKCTGGEGHQNKKADTFLHVQTLHNRKAMSYSLHRFHPIAHELNLKINTSLSLITPVLAYTENSNS